jgi:hypothetical protein
LDFDTVMVGGSSTRALRVSNNNSFDVMVKALSHGRSDVVSFPLTPHLVPANSFVDFTIVWSPISLGDMSAMLGIEVVSGGCLDTVYSLIKGFAKREFPSITIEVEIPDTVVAVGTELDLPLRMIITDSYNSLKGLTIKLQWNNELFHVSEILNGNVQTDASLNGMREVELSLPNVNDQLVLRGTVLLNHPQSTPIRITSISAQTDPGIEKNISVQDGHIQATTCFLPARLIRFSDSVISAVNVVAFDGRLITSIPYSEVYYRHLDYLSVPLLLQFVGRDGSTIGTGIHIPVTR